MKFVLIVEMKEAIVMRGGKTIEQERGCDWYLDLMKALS